VTLQLHSHYVHRLNPDDAVVRIEAVISDDDPNVADTLRLRDETILLGVTVAANLSRALTLASLAPEDIRDRELFRMWRNRSCVNDHVLCFGVSPLYGARERGQKHVAESVSEYYGCATIDDLKLEVARHHTLTCPCWKHAVLREYDRRIR
jgi:hypothetical protein